MDEEDKGDKDNLIQLKPIKSYNWILEIIIGVLLIGFFLFLRAEGYYNSEYIVVKYCDDTVSVSQITQMDWEREYNNIKNSGANLIDNTNDTYSFGGDYNE